MVVNGDIVLADERGVAIGSGDEVALLAMLGGG
jgi:isopentenyl phosphate kinase